ncbi:MAG: hypothetical protein RMJ38_07000 [candidate division WOR-3 bacterium]|nr:hypothetical protein [candidate division WOR-3 bacterium]MDW8151169.1 hypothetical protein [candidate division WOR-3 bacterium]
MKRLIIFFLLSCSKIDITPNVKVSPNPSQIGTYASIILEIPSNLINTDKYLVIHYIYKNTEKREISKLSKQEIYQVFLPESTIGYSVYLIVDTFTVKIEGIRLYKGSHPIENTFFISSQYSTSDSQRLYLLREELKNYPNNIKARSYYDCFLNRKSDTSEIYRIYYEICKDSNNVQSIRRAIYLGDSSFKFLLKLSKFSDTILEIASKKYGDNFEVLLLKLKRLIELGRFREALEYSNYIAQNLNMEWLYKYFPNLSYAERNKKFFEMFSIYHKLKAIAYLNMKDTINYRENFLLYCLNYPNPLEIYDECKEYKR